MEVRWTEPAEPNGIIISYTVYAVQQPDITLNEGSLTEPMDPIVKVSCVLNNHALRLFFHFINPRISSWSLYLSVCVFYSINSLNTKNLIVADYLSQTWVFSVFICSYQCYIQYVYGLAHLYLSGTPLVLLHVCPCRNKRL